MKVSRMAVAIIGASIGIAACGDDDPKAPGVVQPRSQSIVDVAREAGTFETLVGALEATGLDSALEGPGPFTVFAPTDAAFERLPEGVIASLGSEALTEILTYHVTAGRLMASDVVAASSAPTLQSSPVAIDASTGTVILNGTVQVSTTDIMADNGVIHVVDAVMLPAGVAFPGTIVEALSAHPFFASLVQAVVATDLVGTLSGDNSGDGYTIFAPTNAAFDALGVDLSTLTTEDLTNILLYHAIGSTVDAATVVGLSSAMTIEGSSLAIDTSDGVMLNDSANVVRTDLVTSNGIIHVIDAVLLPAP